MPQGRFISWSLDFITDLPECGGYTGIMCCVDRLTKYVRLVPVRIGAGELSAERVAKLFFVHVVAVFGVPREVLHDRDPRFTGSFWAELWRLLGTRTLFSSAYHP